MQIFGSLRQGHARVGSHAPLERKRAVVDVQNIGIQAWGSTNSHADAHSQLCPSRVGSRSDLVMPRVNVSGH